MCQVTAIEEIKERLKKYPELKYNVSGSTITIDAPSPDGFSVSLIEGTSEWIVHFDGWHEHFDSKDAALNCFAFGLSDECRLEITLRGKFSYVGRTVEDRQRMGIRQHNRANFLSILAKKTGRVSAKQCSEGHITNRCTRSRGSREN